MHVWQYLTLTTIPLTMTSFVGGILGAPLWLETQSAEMLEPVSSSGSGGCGFRGMMPGSLAEVRKSRSMICHS